MLQDEYRTVDLALKNQLIAVFENLYLSTLNNEYIEYTTSYTMDLIKHLYEHYACISLSEMAANNERLRAYYNAEEALESLVERLNECADLATAACKPVLETQLVHISYGLVAETFQYPEDCRAWRNQGEKSWTTFQDHFIEAQADLRMR